jgi:hypothetical protein
MLAGGIAAQTTHARFHTHASLSEHGEQVQVSKPQRIPASTFVSLPKFHLLLLLSWLSSAVKNH